MPTEESVPLNRECTTCPYCDIFMVVAIILATVALSLSLSQLFFGILGILAFFVTIINCCCTTAKYGLLASAILECALSGLLLVHSNGLSTNCDSTAFRYLHCERWPLFTASALWFLSGCFIFYFVCSGRVSEYHKRGISIEAIASPVEDIRQAREDTMQSDGNVDIEEQMTPAVDENEDTMLNANTLSHRIRPTAEEEGISVPFTPATPVNRIKGGTVSFFRNGSHDRQSL